jgi:hypothetical protein
VWERLLTGLVMDALESTSVDPPAQPTDVGTLLSLLRSAAWHPAPAVAEGEEFRTQADATTHASALVFQEAILHGSVVVAT